MLHSSVVGAVGGYFRVSALGSERKQSHECCPAACPRLLLPRLLPANHLRSACR